MSLLERSIDRELPELMERNVRFRVIGRPNGVPSSVRRASSTWSPPRRANTGLTLLMAFNYGGRDELLDAFRALAGQVQAGALGRRTSTRCGCRGRSTPTACRIPTS